MFKSIKQFKGLKYRQQIIFKKKNLTVINDSKSTSFSSTTGILRAKSNIFWIIGGVSKKGDRLKLKKKDLKMLKLLFLVNIKDFLIKNLNIKLNLRILIIWIQL